MQAIDGNFYGTTYLGGSSGVGTLFKITPGGTLTTLHSFNGPDGAYPEAVLVQVTDGTFYGTTQGGGNNNCAYGCGTVFKLSSEGVLTTLHLFDNTDGDSPVAGLVQAADGNFYGTTSSGGARFRGTVFKITPAGTLTTLHTFDGPGGAHSIEGLVQADDRSFYGTTSAGGASDVGTVFRLFVVGACVTCGP